MSVQRKLSKSAVMMLIFFAALQITNADAGTCSAVGEYFDSGQQLCVNCPLPSSNFEVQMHYLRTCRDHPVCCIHNSTVRPDEAQDPRQSASPVQLSTPNSRTTLTALVPSTTRTLVIVGVVLSVFTVVLIIALVLIFHYRKVNNSNADIARIQGDHETVSNQTNEFNQLHLCGFRDLTTNPNAGVSSTSAVVDESGSSAMHRDDLHDNQYRQRNQSESCHTADSEASVSEGAYENSTMDHNEDNRSLLESVHIQGNQDRPSTAANRLIYGDSPRGQYYAVDSTAPDTN